MDLLAALTTNDYYEPLERVDRDSRQFRPTTVPDGWTEVRHERWRAWHRPDIDVPDQGWKIHVSATLGRAQHVLDTVASQCFDERVTFKHLATETAYLLAHHKHGSRIQAGKFCTIYPPDETVGRQLMDRLSDALRDEQGPYILTDRRYRDSTVVHYRYGAFRPAPWVRPDGTPESLVRDATGRLVPDLRTVRFTLPQGVPDPFVTPPPEPAASTAGSGGIRIGAYRVQRALAHSNAGGAYQGVDQAGMPVFMKEARAHNGLYWDRSTARERLRREHRILRELHALAPGLAPRPLDHFGEWEHVFLVTELVPGAPLHGFLARTNPYLNPVPEAEFSAYFARCRAILGQLEAALDRLHELGYRFGDVNPWNMLVTEDGALRLIDFESCNRLDEPPLMMGAPGYAPERAQDWQGTGADEYGRSAIAMAMLAPLQPYAQRHPAMLDHFRADLDRQARLHAGRAVAVPPDLWRAATRNLNPTGDNLLPTVEEFAADPIGRLSWLRDAIGRDLAIAADPDDPDRMFPTVPRGYETNTLCAAYGAAGVVHALHHAGLPVDERVVRRLRDEAWRRRTALPPGLHFGVAGIGWVLAERGLLEEATALVGAAAAHPALASSATWGAGVAGVGAARLALHAYAGDPVHRDAAARLGDQLCEVADMTPLVGPRNAIGLLHGRAGISLFLHQLWRATGEKRYLRHGLALLHLELDRATDVAGGQLGFSDDESGQRVMHYLAAGSAGVGLVLTRYLHAGGDERLADAAPRVFGYADRCVAMEPGLYQGVAGLAFAHAEHADLAGAGEPVYRTRAVELAAALVKYATPAPGGRVRVLGEGGMRFSTELWSGSAGVLLALDRVLRGRNGQFFMLEDISPR
jgi:class III lanthionine synthetase